MSADQGPPEQPPPASSWLSAMRKHAVVLALSFVGLAGFALFTGWAFYATKNMGNGWADLAPIWPYVVGGVAITAILAGFLMWLAFYSANHGYDDRIDSDDL
jgi:sterol desaturase/sphingolipid hydroxylase (fatty acid hydroxylase superfamily)